MAEYLDTDLPIVEIDPVTKELKATPYFENYLYNIIFSLGGEGAEPVSGNNEVNHAVDIPALSARVKFLQRTIDELGNELNDHRLEATVKQIAIDTAGFRGRVEITDYTAENKEWIEARGRITIKLPSDPLVNDQVIVSNGDGAVITIQGNGNDIKYTDKDTSINIRNQGTSLHFQLFEDESTKYWRIR
jgi:hypothetical protein